MKVNRELCKTILSKDYPTQDYEVINWQLDNFDKVIGFLGQHRNLKISFKIDGKEKKLTFFVKSVLNNPLVLEYFKNIRCYEKEFYMLNNVVNVLQSQTDVKLTAKCYVNELNKYVIFEDLSACGYSSTDMITAKTWDHIKSTIEKLAIFHSTSMVLEERSGMSISQRFPEIEFESLFNPIETDAGSTFRACHNILTFFVFHKVDEISLNNKEGFTEWVISKMLKLIKPVDKYRNVVNHGDPWVMNFMYKYNEDGKIEDVLLVDLQFSRIAPPAFELQIFLGLRYSYEEIISKGPTLLSAYYDVLANSLTKGGLEPSNILTMETLLESFNYYRCAGVIAKAMYTMLTEIPQEYLLTLNTPEQYIKLMSQGYVELCSKAFENNETYRKSCVQAILGAYKEYLIDTEIP